MPAACETVRHGGFCVQSGDTVIVTRLQVLEMMRLVFPKHIVDLATTGHRIVAENINCAVVLSLHVHGFRTMSSSVPMVSAVSKVSSLLGMISSEILSRGIEQVDMAHDKYIACAIAECASLSLCQSTRTLLTLHSSWLCQRLLRLICVLSLRIPVRDVPFGRAGAVRDRVVR